MEGEGRSPSPSSSSGEELPDFSQVLNGTHHNTNNSNSDAQVPVIVSARNVPPSVPVPIAAGSSAVNRDSRSPSTDSTSSLPSYENVLNRTEHSPSDVHIHGQSSNEIQAQTSAGAQDSVLPEQGESSTAGVQTRSSVQSTLDSFRLPPVMPNLANQAIQRLKEREGSNMDEGR